jgi:hypothetical protein
MYEIYTDVEKNLIKVVLEGFWSTKDFDQFISDESAAKSRLRCPPGKHILLCDLSNFKVVNKEIVDGVFVELNRIGPNDAEWIAIVCQSALLKLQFKRLLERPRAMIFDNVSSAEDWLCKSAGY